MLALIVVVTFVLLARAFRSLLLPLKAVLLNLVSLGAAWGVMVLIWQDGHGSSTIWGIPATGSITSWIPVMVFAFLYGLSMDYEVFILARIREEYDASGSTSKAIVEGIGRTGRLVTSAAIILFLAFVSLGSSPGTEIKILATGLAVGIVLDATVIRMLLVPALLSLFGRWNWWLPAGVARLLRVEPSPLTPREAGTPGSAGDLGLALATGDRQGALRLAPCRSIHAEEGVPARCRHPLLSQGNGRPNRPQARGASTAPRYRSFIRVPAATDRPWPGQVEPRRKDPPSC